MTDQYQQDTSAGVLNAAIDTYFAAKDQVHALLAYQPDWVEIPMEDQRGMYWMLTDGEESGVVVWSPEPFTTKTIADGKVIYIGHIYTQRFLPKYVYRTSSHVMVSVDTHTDGNKFLMIFSADKECTDEKLMQVAKNHWG